MGLKTEQQRFASVKRSAYQISTHITEGSGGTGGISARNASGTTGVTMNTSEKRKAKRSFRPKAQSIAAANSHSDKMSGFLAD